MHKRKKLPVLVMLIIITAALCCREWNNPLAAAKDDSDDNPETPADKIWSYQYDSDFVTSLDKQNAMPHGVVVTPDGRIWIGFYHYSDLLAPGGEQISPLWIYNPDGSLNQKLVYLTWQGSTLPITGDCRGLSLDQNGNVLFSEFDRLWRIDYQTRQATNRVTPFAGSSLTEAACDQNGYIYITNVLNTGQPIQIYDTNFNPIKAMTGGLNYYKRSVVASADGKDIYIGRMSGNAGSSGIIHYHSDTGPQGNYSEVDTLQLHILTNCLDLDHQGLLWAGSYFQTTGGDYTGWYALDLNQQGKIVYSLGANAGTPSDNTIPAGGTFFSPRGAAWSADRRTMYTADFDGRVIKKWILHDE